MDERCVVFAGECQLLGWKVTHNAGAQVVLQLQDEDDIEKFKRLTVRKGKVAGHRLMVAVTEIGDDEQPVFQPTAGDSVHGKPALKGGPLAILAGRWCALPEFRQWVEQRWPSAWERARHTLIADSLGAPPDEVAAEVIRLVCGVGSRAELDHNDEAAREFHLQFRQPFSAYLEQHRDPASG